MRALSLWPRYSAACCRCGVVVAPPHEQQGEPWAATRGRFGRGPTGGRAALKRRRSRCPKQPASFPSYRTTGVRAPRRGRLPEARTRQVEPERATLERRRCCGDLHVPTRARLPTGEEGLDPTRGGSCRGSAGMRSCAAPGAHHRSVRGPEAPPCLKSPPEHPSTRCHPRYRR